MNMWFMGASITWHRFVDGLWDKVRCPLVHFIDIACGVNGVLGLAQVRDREKDCVGGKDLGTANPREARPRSIVEANNKITAGAPVVPCQLGLTFPINTTR